MNETLRKRLAGAFDDCDEDGNEFIAFLPQRGQLCCGDDAAIDQQFEPVSGFLGLAQRVTAFGDELRFAASSVCFAIVRADRSSGAEHLFSEYLCFSDFGKFGVPADDTQCEGLCAFE